MRDRDFDRDDKSSGMGGQPSGSSINRGSSDVGGTSKGSPGQGSQGSQDRPIGQSDTMSRDRDLGGDVDEDIDLGEDISEGGGSSGSTDKSRNQ